MGKGRAPCCDKTKVKRGPWSPDEDMKLISFIHEHGHENWRSLPKQAGLLRCGKSCRLRWINYLRPDVKRGNFTAEEEETIIKLHRSFGNKWSKIASHLPGRTDNEIKNVWHTHLKKRLVHNSENSLQDGESASSCLSESHSPEKHEGGDEAKPHVEDPEGSSTEKTSPSELSSSSTSSGGSNVINPEDDIQLGDLFGYVEGYTGTTEMFQEVDKPDLLEITFGSDPNIWSLLDGLDASHEPATANENSSASRVGGESDEDEVKKWFKYLENELLLEEDDDNQHHKPGTIGEEESSSLLRTYELIIDY